MSLYFKFINADKANHIICRGLGLGLQEIET